MKFNDILMAIDQETKIRVTVTMYAMQFSTEEKADFFLDHDETDKLLDKRVTDIKVLENRTLEVVLENNE